MFSTVRGIVSSPSVATPPSPPPCSTSQSTAARTTVLPTPAPCRSGRTASGPIHPDEPVPPVAVRERVREHPVQGLRVPLGRGLGAVHLALRQPRPHR